MGRGEADGDVNGQTWPELVMLVMGMSPSVYV